MRDGSDRREQHADAWEQVFDLAQAVEDAPAEAIAAAAMLKPGQHVFVRIGDRYFEAKRPVV